MSFERRNLRGDAFALVSTQLEDRGFLAAFTERTGGVSEEPRFASLNLSFSSGDDPVKVRANRGLVTTVLGVGPFAVGGQVHGADLAEVTSSLSGRGFTDPSEVITRTDGLHTAERKVPLAVATADCAPIVLVSPGEGRIAVVHAGWRGVSAGIVERAMSLFDMPRDVCAAIGPCAGGCCYEVGHEVVSALNGGTTGEVAVESRDGSVYLDLAKTIERSLTVLGAGAIEISGECTIHSPRFFSHRGEGPCGRQMAIGMKL